MASFVCKTNSVEIHVIVPQMWTCLFPIIGARNDATCASIVSLDGHIISCTREIQYFNICMVSSTVFKCYLHHAKCDFYRAANAILGKVDCIFHILVVCK